MLVGNRAPYTAKHAPTAAELQLWERHRAEASATAQTGLTVAETLAYIRHPDWTWPADNAAPATPAHAQYGVR